MFFNKRARSELQYHFLQVHLRRFLITKIEQVCFIIKKGHFQSWNGGMLEECGKIRGTWPYAPLLFGFAAPFTSFANLYSSTQPTSPMHVTCIYIYIYEYAKGKATHLVLWSRGRHKCHIVFIFCVTADVWTVRRWTFKGSQEFRPKRFTAVTEMNRKLVYVHDYCN